MECFHMAFTKMGNDFARTVTILSCQKYKLKSKAKVEQRAVGLSWSFRREKDFLIDIYNIRSYAEGSWSEPNQREE